MGKRRNGFAAAMEFCGGWREGRKGARSGREGREGAGVEGAGRRGVVDAAWGLWTRRGGEGRGGERMGRDL